MLFRLPKNTYLAGSFLTRRTASFFLAPFFNLATRTCIKKKYSFQASPQLNVCKLELLSALALIHSYSATL